MPKFIVFLFLLIVIPLLFSSHAFAEGNFDIVAKNFVKVADDGEATVTQSFTIVNKAEYVYTQDFSIDLAYPDLKDVSVSNSAGKLETTVTKTGKGNKIKVHFPKKLIGENQQNKFTVSYTTSDIAKEDKNGWEIAIPAISLSSDFSEYDFAIEAPSTFGQAVLVIPRAKSKSANIYNFSKQDLTKNGIYMSFKKGGMAVIPVAIKAKLPKNALFALPIDGIVEITNLSSVPIEGQILDIVSSRPQNSVSYKISKIEPYETKVLGVSLGRTPFLTIESINTKISFNGVSQDYKIEVGFLPDYHLIILGGIICVGSLIVAAVAVKTWRLHFQKRKR